MIFIHLLLGILLGQIYGTYFWFIAGSVFPDLDHLYIIVKHKLWKKGKIIDSLKHEEKYNIKYKTPLFHSLLGLMIFSLIILFFTKIGAIIFASMYLLHLLIDGLDIDEKYSLYPFKIKFKGFIPIWTKIEQALTIILLLIILLMLKIN